MNLINSTNYIESNSSKIKNLSIIFLILCSLIQLILLKNYENIFSILFLFLSNLLILNYCLKKENIFNYPVSIFSIIFLNIYANGGTLFFKSVLFEDLTINLHQPNYTFFLLLVFNAVILITHFFYTKIKFLDRVKLKINNLYRFIKINNENKVMIKDFFILLGISTVFFASLSFTFFGNFIYFQKQTGPNFLGDIINGINIFYISGFVVLYSKKFYNFSFSRKDSFLIFLSGISIFYLSLGLNSRSAFFDLAFVGLLIYAFYFFIGYYEIKVLRLNKIFIVFIFLFFSTSLVDRFSETYIESREIRDKTNPVQNVKNHFSTFLDSKIIKNYDFYTSTNIFNENYYKVNLLNRINIIKATDNVLYAKKFIGNKQLDNLVDYEKGQIISILPSPLIKLFSQSFDKNNFLNFSMTSKIFIEADRSFGGSKSNGLIYPIVYIYNDYSFYLLFFFILILSFLFLDSFYNRKDKSFSILLFLLFYTTGGGLINAISQGSVSDAFALLFRDLPQSIVIIFILFKIFSLVKKKI
jgi:hypothetical protein